MTLWRHSSPISVPFLDEKTAYRGKKKKKNIEDRVASGGARIQSWESDPRSYAHKHSVDKTVSGLGLHVS